MIKNALSFDSQMNKKIKDPKMKKSARSTWPN